jgi:hypothetical protein
MQNHDSEEHQEMMRESWRQISEANELSENRRKHAEWLNQQSNWNQRRLNNV